MSVESVVQEYTREHPEMLASLLKRKGADEASPLAKRVVAHLPVEMLAEYAQVDEDTLLLVDNVEVVNYHNSNEDSDIGTVQVGDLPEILQKLLKCWFEKLKEKENCPAHIRVDFDSDGEMVGDLVELYNAEDEEDEEDEEGELNEDLVDLDEAVELIENLFGNGDIYEIMVEAKKKPWVAMTRTAKLTLTYGEL